jgi:hypothetical protein
VAEAFRDPLWRVGAVVTYLGATRYQSRPRHRLFRLRFSWFSFVPPVTCRDSTSIGPLSLLSEPSPFHLSSYHSTLYSEKVFTISLKKSILEPIHVNQRQLFTKLFNLSQHTVINRLVWTCALWVPGLSLDQVTDCCVSLSDFP